MTDHLDGLRMLKATHRLGRDRAAYTLIKLSAITSAEALYPARGERAVLEAHLSEL